MLILNDLTVKYRTGSKGIAFFLVAQFKNTKLTGRRLSWVCFDSEIYCSALFFLFIGSISFAAKSIDLDCSNIEICD
jgi:hypothetical protein